MTFMAERVYLILKRGRRNVDNGWTGLCFFVVVICLFVEMLLVETSKASLKWHWRADLEPIRVGLDLSQWRGSVALSLLGSEVFY